MRFKPASIALAVAFVAVVGTGRALSARTAHAQSTLNSSPLPTLAREIGVDPLVTLVGRDHIVRVGVSCGKRVYSVFDAAGFPLATRLSLRELQTTFPRLSLDAMQDVATGKSVDRSFLADTPTE